MWRGRGLRCGSAGGEGTRLVGILAIWLVPSAPPLCRLVYLFHIQLGNRVLEHSPPWNPGLVPVFRTESPPVLAKSKCGRWAPAAMGTCVEIL